MIGINWFETVVPEHFRITVQRLAANEIQSGVSDFPYPTFLRRAGAECRRFHLTPQPQAVAHSSIETLLPHAERDLVKRLLQHGFAEKLELQGFDVHFEHVGGTASRDGNESAYPNVYRSIERVRFKAFFFDDSRDSPVRFGLVLSVSAGQRFVVSLDDTTLRQLAIGGRVVPVEISRDEPHRWDSRQESLIFRGSEQGVAILLDAAGSIRREPLGRWTLPGRKDLVRSYVQKTQGEQAANRAAAAIQQADLTLTAERRMNVRLSRDQLRRLQALMRSAELGTFRLPVHDRPLVRLSDSPLTVGAPSDVSP